MPPKPAAKAQKVVEDKTFGLKNKKGKKQQEFVKQVQKNAENKFKVGQPDERKKMKELEAQRKAEINSLFKPVLEKKQVVADNVDPKSVLCSFYKAGQCTKGANCKFSHDLSVENKSEKRNIYDDAREKETMADWDQAQLEDAIAKKEKGNQNRATDIICKYFLDAVEKNLYGWFWECPNGGEKCMYRHALPPGYVLKRDQKKADEGPVITLEELIEEERSKLGHELTPVNPETFAAWKAKKLAEKEAANASNEKKKQAEIKAGRLKGISGRDLFTYKQDLFVDDEGAADDAAYTRDEEAEHEQEDEPGLARNVAPVDESLFEELADLDIDDAADSKEVD